MSLECKIVEENMTRLDHIGCEKDYIYSTWNESMKHTRQISATTFSGKMMSALVVRLMHWQMKTSQQAKWR